MSQNQGDVQLTKEGEKKKSKSNVKEPDKKARWMCPCTISTKWDGAEWHVILVLNQKQVP